MDPWIWVGVGAVAALVIWMLVRENAETKRRNVMKEALADPRVPYDRSSAKSQLSYGGTINTRKATVSRSDEAVMLKRHREREEREEADRRRNEADARLRRRSDDDSSSFAVGLATGVAYDGPSAVGASIHNSSHSFSSYSSGHSCSSSSSYSSSDSGSSSSSSDSGSSSCD
jgi:hypothetical protein